MRDIPSAATRRHASSRTCSSHARSRPTATRRTTSSCSTCPPTTRPMRCRSSASGLREAPGLTVELAGGPAFYGDVQTVSERDLQRSEIISLPLAALALLLVFGSVVAAGVPLVVGGASVLVALAGDLPRSPRCMPMSIFVLNLATLLGLGLGVDYSLLLTSRFREELAKRPDGRPDDAVARGRPDHGRDGGSGGLLQRPDGAARPARPRAVRVHDPALGRHRRGGPGRGLAVLAALTLLPALLTVFGPHLDRFADPPRLAPGPPPTGSWARLARRVMRRPVAVLIPTLGFLLLASARRSCTSGSTRRTPASCRPGVPSRAAFDRLRDAVRRGRVRADRDRGPDRRAGHRPPPNLAALYDYSRRIAADPRVRRVDSLVDVDPRLTLDAIPAPVRATPTARATDSSPRRWRPRPRATSRRSP